MGGSWASHEIFLGASDQTVGSDFVKNFGAHCVDRGAEEGGLSWVCSGRFHCRMQGAGSKLGLNKALTAGMSGHFWVSKPCCSGAEIR